MPKLVAHRERRQTLYVTEPLGADLGLDMVIVPGGSFLMGSPQSGREGPQHLVTVPTFLMGRYPITQAQWQFVAGLKQVSQSLQPDPSYYKGSDRPVERVNWDDAMEFCARLSAYSSRDYRLPTEAEWEYACRAGAATTYHYGEEITPNLVNYESKYNGTTPVNHFAHANRFGLSDMHGNVWEWCLDHWHENYEGAPTDGSAWLDEPDNDRHILRGGSWYGKPWHCRTASRNSFLRDYRGDFSDNNGLRVVCVAP
jgi:formylglycine-generating enzyme required for sulfatase activity